MRRDRSAATCFLAACACCALAALAVPASAQTRRAVIVGIDTYRPASAPPVTTDTPAARRWRNLDGAVNDALAFRELLAVRFGFDRKNIVVLTNEQATRDHILAAVTTHLIDASRKGDVAVFYYAGHGSQVRNSASDEPDKEDESLVPADANKGAQDIRDKELARVFNRVLDRGATLTVVLDSCHSGSATRGVVNYRNPRFIEGDTRDAHDPPDKAPAPEERGALILAAAQDYQVADEARDDQDVAHGLFTLSLLKALQSTGPDEAADRTFLRLRARMQSVSAVQEPAIAAGADRLRQPLFGLGTAPASSALTVAIKGLIGGDNKVILFAGSLLGLRPGVELRRAGRPGDEKDQPRLRIESVDGLEESTATIVRGQTGQIAVGDLYEVDRWVRSPDMDLRVYVPAGGDATLARQAAQAAADLAREGVRVVADPTEQAPTHVVSWDGGAWSLQQGVARTGLGTTLSAAQVVKAIGAARGDVRLFVSAPPPAAAVADVSTRAGTDRSNVVVQKSAAGADYQLIARAVPGEPDGSPSIQCAWVLGAATTGASTADLPLPAKTGWQECVSDDAHTELAERAQRLGRIKGWLLLEAPPGADSAFPYHLAIVRTRASTTQADVGTHVGPLARGTASGVSAIDAVTVETARKGDTVRFELRADPTQLAAGVTKRHVYLMDIDSSGAQTLLFPMERAGTSSRLPIPDAEGRIPSTIVLRSDVPVSEPFGLDTLVLLTTDTPINAEILNYDPKLGARGDARGARGKGPDNPLESLLTTGIQTRGFPGQVPATWSIERVFVRTVAGGTEP